MHAITAPTTLMTLMVIHGSYIDISAPSKLIRGGKGNIMLRLSVTFIDGLLAMCARLAVIV